MGRPIGGRKARSVTAWGHVNMKTGEFLLMRVFGVPALESNEAEAREYGWPGHRVALVEIREIQRPPLDSPAKQA